MALHIWVGPLTLYSLHFFDVLLLQSLQKPAFNLTSIPAALQASSLLPLDPPSHGSAALSYTKQAPNEAKISPFAHRHVARPCACRRTGACTLAPRPFSGRCVTDPASFGVKSPPHLSVFYTSHSLTLSPARSVPPLSLWGDEHESACGF